MTTDIERGGIELSQPHEPSYYEIALTNRQVVVAFVILLVCVVAAFLSGVWIGRESAVRAQDKMALLAQRAASDTAADKEKAAGQPLQELQFFADPRHRPAAGATAPDGTPATSAAGHGGAARDDASADAPDAGPQAPPAPSRWTSQAGSPAGSAGGANGAGGSAGSKGRPAAAARAATAAPDEPSGEGEAPGDTGSVVRPRPLPDGPGPAAAGAKSASAAAAARQNESAAAAARRNGSVGPAARQDKSASAAVKPSEAAAAPDAGGASGAAASSGDMVIQVFSSADREQADRVRAGLVDAGFQAFLSPLAKNGQTMYRVRIGPFASRAAAEPVAEKVRKEQKLDTWITPK